MLNTRNEIKKGAAVKEMPSLFIITAGTIPPRTTSVIATRALFGAF
jgi:hypothetical protein